MPKQDPPEDTARPIATDGYKFDHPVGALAVAMVDAHEALMAESETELEAFRRIRDAHALTGPVFVVDGITPERLRELVKEMHDFGPHGPVLVGVGSDIRQYQRPGDDEVLKVRLDSGQPEALDKMMAANGLELVPYMVNGEIVRQDTLEEVRERASSGLKKK